MYLIIIKKKRMILGIISDSFISIHPSSTRLCIKRLLLLFFLLKNNNNNKLRFLNNLSSHRIRSQEHLLDE